MEFQSPPSRASILTLPIETRFMIYDYILKFTGSLVVFSQYELVKNVDKQTTHLLHVNRLIRAEVQEYFYKQQQFQFRSVPAIKKFLDKIGPYYTSIIKKVQIGSWLAQRREFDNEIRPLLRRLTSLDQLAIIAPAPGFVTKWSENAELGDKALTVLRASERFSCGKIYLVWWPGAMDAEIRFVSQDIARPTPAEFHSSDYLSKQPKFSKNMFYAELTVADLLEDKDSQKPEIESNVTQKGPDPWRPYHAAIHKYKEIIFYHTHESPYLCDEAEYHGMDRYMSDYWW